MRKIPTVDEVISACIARQREMISNISGSLHSEFHATPEGHAFLTNRTYHDDPEIIPANKYTFTEEEKQKINAAIDVLKPQISEACQEWNDNQRFIRGEN